MFLHSFSSSFMPSELYVIYLLYSVDSFLAEMSELFSSFTKILC